MARKKIRITPEERRAYDERTKMIWDYIAKLQRRVDEKRAREEKASSAE